jgi:hypothetical protein
MFIASIIKASAYNAVQNLLKTGSAIHLGGKKNHVCLVLGSHSGGYEEFH